jgi:hypothetical protein
VKNIIYFYVSGQPFSLVLTIPVYSPKENLSIFLLTGVNQILGFLFQKVFKIVLLESYSNTGMVCMPLILRRQKNDRQFQASPGKVGETLSQRQKRKVWGHSSSGRASA